MNSHFDSVTTHRFAADLAEKDEVLLLEDDGGELQGFSTLRYWDEEFESEPLRILFSGDTIIDSAYWGSQALAFSWIERAGRLHAEAPGRRLLWFLLVKGHRTYRYLPTFAVTFYPDWRVANQPGLKRIADHLAIGKFGSNYRIEQGVIHFLEGRGQLASQFAEPSPREAMRPDVQFFIKSNPQYRQGDELVCLCELSENNLQPIARRVFCQGMLG